ncbi:MAG: BatA and WFA domain-containing protein [Verrucomicrobiota bacterium]
MPFSFLNPWLWLGALAIAAPLWLHLRRKQPENLVRFSTLRFLDDQPRPQQSPLRLRHPLLFLLRTLAVLLIAAAFAWPFLKKAQPVIVKESRVYILDNTLSHQANRAFLQARDHLARELASTGRDLQIAVVELSSQARVIIQFGDDRVAAAEVVKGLQPSFQRGSFLAAFRQANSLLGNSLGEKRRIIFLTDNQENQWTENNSSPAFLRAVDVDVPKPSMTLSANLHLAEPRVQRVFLGDKSLINFSAQLTRQGEVRRAAVALRSNGQTLVQKEIEFGEKEETMTLQAQWESDPQLWLRGEVEAIGQPDALEGDNKLYFSLPPVREGKVALLAHSPFLRVALSPDVMRGRWQARIVEPARLGEEVQAGQDADVLVVESNYLQSSEARQLVQRYLSNERGVVLLINRITPTVNGALRELGFEPAGRAEKRRGEKFKYVSGQHPVFHPFVASDFGNLSEVELHSYVRLNAPQAIPLAFAESGDAVFFQGTRAKGKLFVAAFGLDRDQTSWPVHVTFIPFLDLCLQSARATEQTPAVFEPGDAYVLGLPSDHSAREVVIRRADGEGAELGRFVIAQNRAQLKLPGAPGVYTFGFDDQKEPAHIFSINPSPKESRLKYLNPVEIVHAWQQPEQRGPANEKASSAAPLRAGILQQRFWWWVLLAAAAALLIEMAICARQSLAPERSVHPGRAAPHGERRADELQLS